MVVIVVLLRVSFVAVVWSVLCFDFETCARDARAKQPRYAKISLDLDVEHDFYLSSKFGCCKPFSV